jgi:hypothetical protein
MNFSTMNQADGNLQDEIFENLRKVAHPPERMSIAWLYLAMLQLTREDVHYRALNGFESHTCKQGETLQTMEK